MYEEFFHLRERPFTLLPDPDFLYLSPQHKLAKAYLEYGIHQRVGFVVLTGEVGTGKTTLIKSLLRARERNQRIGILYQTSVSAADLLDFLLREFEVRGNFNSRTARLAAFNHFLLRAYGRGENVVLVVDEAQNLGPDALEELRLLSNIQTEKEPLLQVILVGQPRLRDRLRHPALRQLAQRVSVHYHLSPLSRQETKEYIAFRLARAGGSGIFSESALEKLYQYTNGVPRRINAWCDLSLVAGFAEGRREIDGDFIDIVFESQGGSLEGPASEDAYQADANGLSTPLNVVDSISADGLSEKVSEISSRLTRLEGLVLEISSQLFPIITKILSDHLARMSTVEEIPPPPNANDNLVLDQTQESRSIRKHWWSRFWAH